MAAFLTRSAKRDGRVALSSLALDAADVVAIASAPLVDGSTAWVGCNVASASLPFDDVGRASSTASPSALIGIVREGAARLHSLLKTSHAI